MRQKSPTSEISNSLPVRESYGFQDAVNRLKCVCSDNKDGTELAPAERQTITFKENRPMLQDFLDIFMVRHAMHINDYS